MLNSLKPKESLLSNVAYDYADFLEMARHAMHRADANPDMYLFDNPAYDCPSHLCLPVAAWTLYFCIPVEFRRTDALNKWARTYGIVCERWETNRSTVGRLTMRMFRA